ncbi:hypothetical protein [Photobacterium rosenbergii]|uniref:hypothetical protein n=1 Tax=Photobacterium rosenbergii TaxID=294936 RepID=UPI001C996FDC|nr:hypothetical protein [Photobacterium rosenbergii]MBY5948878.1 hypothetical protein [Photobacterium rosenbergii]
MKIKHLLFTSIFFSATASSCLFHGNVDGTLSPKGAPWTLVTTQLEVNQGGLLPIKILDGDAAFRRAMWWLNLFTRSIEQQSTLDEVYIYLTDAKLWAYFNRDNSPMLQFENNPATLSSVEYIALSQTTLSNILSDQITIAQGVDKELVLLSPGFVWPPGSLPAKQLYL